MCAEARSSVFMNMFKHKHKHKHKYFYILNIYVCIYLCLCLCVPASRSRKMKKSKDSTSIMPMYAFKILCHCSGVVASQSNTPSAHQPWTHRTRSIVYHQVASAPRSPIWEDEETRSRFLLTFQLLFVLLTVRVINQSIHTNSPSIPTRCTHTYTLSFHSIHSSSQTILMT